MVEDRELYEERTAIMEFEGGLARLEAELKAAALIEAAVAKPYRERN
jgi:hypothetical protein